MFFVFANRRSQQRFNLRKSRHDRVEDSFECGAGANLPRPHIRGELDYWCLHAKLQKELRRSSTQSFIADGPALRSSRSNLWRRAAVHGSRTTQLQSLLLTLMPATPGLQIASSDTDQQR